jgi:hypothetical protein
VDLPILVLILALLLAIAWLFRKRRESIESDSSPTSKLRPKGVTEEHHSVSIVLSEKSCAAAQELSGRRILATTAPKLPLPACDIPECACRFEHHQDRRANRDRRDPFSPGIIGGGSDAEEADQRGSSDRRDGADS